MNTTNSALTKEQIALLPNDDEVQFYKEHGWYKSGKLFADDELDAVVAATERFYAGESEDLFGLPMGELFDGFIPKPGTDYGDKLRKNDYASFQCRELANLVRHPLLGAIAARLAGDDVRLWHDQLLYKPSEVETGKPANVGWHTDRGYWKTCTSINLLTAWVPFHDCDAEMGTITMMDGSLHWPDNTNGLDFFSNDLDGLEKKFDTGGRPVVRMPIELKKGEVSFHHCLTIHGSSANRSRLPRRSIAVHMQDAANRYQTCHHWDGRLATHYNDTLARKNEQGQPDYTDPVPFPTLGKFA